MRFREPAVTVWEYATDGHPILVHCPRCDGRAAVVTRPGHEAAAVVAWRRTRVVCESCGHAADTVDARAQAASARWAGTRCATDPWHRLPLWLRTSCRGEELWAYNGAHVAHLRSFVAADLRESPGMTMGARLPRWITAAGHRADVLRALDRLDELHLR